MNIIVTAVKKLFSKGLEVLREECKEVIESVNINLITSCLKLIKAFILSDHVGDLEKTNMF